MEIFNSLLNRIKTQSKPKHAETASRVRGGALFETLEPRVFLDGSTLANIEDAHEAAEPTMAYTHALHPRSASLVPANGKASGGHRTHDIAFQPEPLGTVNWRAEWESLPNPHLRASETGPAMRPRRPNLVTSLGATPSAGAAEHPTQKSPTAPTPVAATQVLIVEDDVLTGKGMARALRANGFDVAVATTVAEGIQKLAGNPGHVILDLTLPDGDGEEILRHIRDLGMQTRVTITSGSDDADRMASVRELGAADVLNKPVDAASLLSRFGTARQPATVG